MSDNENVMITKKHYLILVQKQLVLNKINKFNELSEKEINKFKNEIDYLEKNFCGNVINSLEQIIKINSDNLTNIFIMGDIEKNIQNIKNHNICYKKIFIINELCWGNFVIYPDDYIQIINLGNVPININNVGIYFRNCFNTQTNWFKSVSEEHKFQSLTESNKESNAFRTGIYLTPVEILDTNNSNKVKFNLMMSSTNFEGSLIKFL